MTNRRPSQRGGLGYAAICDALRARVARGELRPGDRLAPMRELAAELGVNVNTVARAYAELAREGVLVSQAGGGTHVAADPQGAPYQQAREARLHDIVGRAVLQALGLGYRPEQVEAAVVAQAGRWRSQEGHAPSPPLAETPLVFVGSHDLTIELLASRLALRQPPIHLQARYAGSLEGLLSLARGEAHLAGCHLLDEQTGEYNAPFVVRLLPGRAVTLVTLALREQGLIVRPGNPKSIGGPADLARPDVAVAARQYGSGTRALLDYRLRQAGISPEALPAGTRAYDTHLAVAGAIAGGVADVGLGIRAAARAYGLDFIPLATERYELAIPERRLAEPNIRAVLETLDDEGFRRAAEALGGYDLSVTGRRRTIG
jgi:molybdate-binding protein/DNA-binding transcriptional regulator YhcF (GntR family)